ncbi:MAG: hypothetical protein OEQ53_18955, partial [Saprospiraceae bacterium]|nr:hypothetical protein [Saprospiraceae bacterium]
PLFRPDWVFTTGLAVLGSIIMFASACLYFMTLFHTLFSKKTEEGALEFPPYEVLHDEPKIALLDNFRPWLALMGVIILLAYLPALSNVFEYTGANSPPYDPENPIPLELYENPND